MTTVSIAGLPRAAVLAALFNNSHQQGMGFLQPRGAQPMTVEQAADILAATPHGYFDYLHGRVLKVDLSTDDVDPYLYDRDLGPGALARAVDQVRRQVANAA